MSQIPPLPEPVPSAVDLGDPYFKAAIYRGADGQITLTIVGQQHNIDGYAAALPSGLSLTVLPEGVSFNAVVQYGFIDIDDPARPLCYDADKLKAAGVTLAQILATPGEPTSMEPPFEWMTLTPIKKPTKAT